MSYNASKGGLAGFQSWSAAKTEGYSLNNRVHSININKSDIDHANNVYGFRGIPMTHTTASPPLEMLHSRILQAKLQNTLLKQRVINEVIKNNNVTKSSVSNSESYTNDSELLIRINKLEEQLKRVTTFAPDPMINNENIVNTENNGKVATARRDDKNTARKDEKNAPGKVVNSARLKNAASMAKAENLFKSFSKKKAEEIDESDDLNAEEENTTSEVIYFPHTHIFFISLFTH